MSAQIKPEAVDEADVPVGLGASLSCPVKQEVDNGLDGSREGSSVQFVRREEVVEEDDRSVSVMGIRFANQAQHLPQYLNPNIDQQGGAVGMMLQMMRNMEEQRRQDDWLKEDLRRADAERARLDAVQARAEQAAREEAHRAEMAQQNQAHREREDRLIASQAAQMAAFQQMMMLMMSRQNEGAGVAALAQVMMPGGVAAQPVAAQPVAVVPPGLAAPLAAPRAVPLVADNAADSVPEVAAPLDAPETVPLAADDAADGVPGATAPLDAPRPPAIVHDQGGNQLDAPGTGAPIGSQGPIARDSSEVATTSSGNSEATLTAVSAVPLHTQGSVQIDASGVACTVVSGATPVVAPGFALHSSGPLLLVDAQAQLDSGAAVPGADQLDAAGAKSADPKDTQVPANAASGIPAPAPAAHDVSAPGSSALPAPAPPSPRALASPTRSNPRPIRTLRKQKRDHMGQFVASSGPSASPTPAASSMPPLRSKGRPRKGEKPISVKKLIVYQNSQEIGLKCMWTEDGVFMVNFYCKTCKESWGERKELHHHFNATHRK